MIEPPAAGAGPIPQGHVSTWLGLAGALAGALFVHPFRSALPPGEDEVFWLASARGLARSATDLWVGHVPNDALMRLPVLVIVLGALLATAWLGSRRAGPLAAFGAPVCAGALLAPWLETLPVASPAPWGLLAAALVVVSLGLRRWRLVLLVLPLASLAAALLEPGAAPVLIGATTGACLGSWMGDGQEGNRTVQRPAATQGPRNGHGHAGRDLASRSASEASYRGARSTSAVASGVAGAAAVAGWLTAGALLVLHPPVLSPPGTQPKSVLLLQTLVIASALAAVSWAALRLRRPTTQKRAIPGESPMATGRVDDDASRGIAAVSSRTESLGAHEAARGRVDTAPSEAGSSGRGLDSDALDAGLLEHRRDHVLAFTALGALSGGAGWLLVPALRAFSLAPAAALLYLAASLGALGASALTRSRARPPGAVSWPAFLHSLPVICLAALALSAWTLARPRPSRPVPLTSAVGSMKGRNRELGQVFPGPGLTRGVLRHATSSTGLEVVSSPEQPLVGTVGLAAVTPSLRERDETAARLGDRALDTYGIIGGQGAGGGPAVRWAVFRPLAVRLEQDGSRPNIAIVSVDTLRADHLSVYGYSRRTSPRLLQWSQRGLVFDRAMAAAPSTAPSFSSLLTGRLPVGHGVRKNYEFLDPGNWTLPRLLKRAGYQTAAFVSSFVLTAENSGLDLGFDVYDQTFELSERNRKDRPLRLAPALTAAVVPWLKQRRQSEAPWFLWVHAIDPHGPYTPLAEYAHAFEDGPGRTLPRKVIPDYQWLESVELSDYVNAYDDEILQTDASLGTILEEIGRLDGPRGTLVIFVADHGEAFGEHGIYFQHGQSLHEEEIHVPLILEDTRAPRAGRIATPVSVVDIVPTILARLRITSDLPLDGVTLDDRESAGDRDTKPVAPRNDSMRLARERDARFVAATWKPGEVMVCRWPWKLMIRGGRADAASSRLYDIVNDPQEAHPLPAGSAVSDLIKAARRILDRDPLTPKSGALLDAQQWEALDPDAKQKLKSLGYGGP